MDDLQSKIETARRAGYSDAQIQTFLKSKGIDPSVVTPKPTILSDAIKRGDQVVDSVAAIGRSQSPVEAIARTAELPLRALGAAGGFVGDVVGQKVIAPALQGTGLDKPVSSVVNTVASSPVGQAVGNAYQKLPAEVRQSISDTANAATFIPVGAGAKVGSEAAITGAKAAVKTGAKATEYAGNITRDIVPSAQGVINHQVSRALDLTPGDLNNIARSTGNDVGTWLSQNNLIGKNKGATQNLVNDFYSANYKTVRDQVSQVKNLYKPSQIPGYTDALKQIQLQIKGVPGLQKTVAEVDNLLNADKIKGGIALSDVQRVKELLDEHFSLYKATGDVKEGVAKEGLANLRGELRSFIENEVKATTGQDIGALNNNVATARSISDAITTRSPRGLTRANLKIGDLGFFGIGSVYGGPLVGLALVFGKKVLESPTIRLRVARYLDKVSDAKKAKLQAQLEKGKVPAELEALAKTGKEAPKE